MPLLQQQVISLLLEFSSYCATVVVPWGPTLVRHALDSNALRFKHFQAVAEHKLQTDKHVTIL